MQSDGMCLLMTIDTDTSVFSFYVIVQWMFFRLCFRGWWSCIFKDTFFGFHQELLR